MSKREIVHTCYGCKFYYRVNSDGKKEWCVPFCYRHCDIENVWDCDYFANDGEPNVNVNQKESKNE